MNARMGLSPRILLSLLVTWTLWAAEVSAQQPPATQPREHVVRRGDTLWDLAQAYLMNPFLWPRIFEANRSSIRDPHWIYPDQRFVIPGVEDTVGIVIQPAAQPAMPVAMPAGALERTRFYTIPVRPEPDTSESSRVAEGAVEPYAVQPMEYLAAPWLADTAGLEIRGRMVQSVDPATRKDRLPSRLHPYDRVHVGRLRGARPTIGDSLLSVRIGDRVGDRGRVVTPLAVLEVDSLGEDVVIARVVKQYAGATVGDLVISTQPLPSLPRGPGQVLANGAEGRILEFEAAQPLYGTTDQGFIDMGRMDGIRLGDELVAYLPESRAGTGAAAERLPSIPIAALRVVRVEERSATVRVLSVANTALDRGYRVRVVRRMQ